MFRGVDELEVSGKRVLLRVDFNVPLDAAGDVVDDTRIRAALPTIRSLLERGATLVLTSHLGRPKGRQDERYRLAAVARRLAELLGRPVRYAATPGPASAEQQAFVAAAPPGSVTLLENSRFDPREEANDPGLARVLASFADLYVNDAFGAAHRAHATTEAVARLLPSAAGRLMAAELTALSHLVEAPERPFAVVLGGAKVSDKLAVIERLLRLADIVVIGGAMAYTFVAAQGGEVGRSLVEPDMFGVAQDVMEQAAARGVRLLLPSDSVCAAAIEPGVATSVHPSGAIPADLMGLDIGPVATAEFERALADAKTVFWNGPLGVFETPPFDAGTRAVAQAIARLDAFTVVGGGDSIAALNAAQVLDRISHVSTGGGASLEFLEGRTLPGVAALEGA